MAEPIPGLGIAVPVFMPVLVTVIVAVVLSREDSAPLAYIAGSLGTLIGADLTESQQGPRPRCASRLDRRCRNF
jgi:uncharacterized membrane protein